MVFARDMAAMNAANKYKTNVENEAKSTEKLSSGYKINRAADNAAGLTVSEKMRWQIKGLNKGTTNTQDGISYLSVSDGALNEVHDMLHRMKELSIQAANDTNTEADRAALQSEMKQIISEIDRIGDTTEFNTRPVFKGRDVPVNGNNGLPIIAGDIPAASWSVADMSLGTSPFDSGSEAGRLNLSAVVNNNTPDAVGTEMGLIYGRGNTSNSYVRIISPTGQPHDYDMSTFTVDQGSFSYDAATNTWSRSMSQDGIKIIQQIQGVNESDSKKYYKMSYTICNEGTNPAFAAGSKAIFMFNADTAYGGNSQGDHEESYYTSSGKLDNNKVYSTTDSALTPQTGYDGYGVDYSGIPGDISIINTKRALSFSEKIELETGNVINMGIGHYYEMNDIGTFDDKDKLLTNSNTSTENEDLGFSIAWDLGDLSTTNQQTISFKYGIVATQNDSNLNGVTLTPDRTFATRHEQTDELWIQCGALEGSGIKIGVDEMDSNVLGISGVNVSSHNSAQNAISRVDGALEYVNNLRSKIGAQQNRLEHIVNIDTNTSENTQSAESQIRDTDMAEEMVENTKYNILSQAGISMISQANSSRQAVLGLLNM